MSKNFYIYLITNKKLNKKYIGSRMDYSGNPQSDNYMGSSISLNMDISVYGIENFSKEIIKEDIYNKINMLNEETKYILEYNTLVPNGYNRHLPNLFPSFHMAEYKHTDKAKEKIGKASKGNKYALGNKWSEETREKVRKALIGRKRPQEVVEKIRNSNIGRKISEETRLKLINSHLGIIPSQETIEKRKIKMIGHKVSEETKQKISNANKGQISWNKGLKLKLPKEIHKKRSFKKENNPMFGRSIFQVWMERYSLEETLIREKIWKERIKESNKGRKNTEETKEKMRKSALGKKMSEEAKKNMSIAKLGKKRGNYKKKII